MKNLKNKKKVKASYDKSKLNGIIFLSQKKEYAFENEWFKESMNNNFWMKWRLKSFLNTLNSIDFPTNKKKDVLLETC